MNLHSNMTSKGDSGVKFLAVIIVSIFNTIEQTFEFHEHHDIHQWIGDQRENGFLLKMCKNQENVT